MEGRKAEGSNALKAGTWYVVSSIIVKSIVVISTPIFARLMTTEEFGLVSTFVSWYAIFSAVATLNLTYSIGRAKLDFPGKLDKYIGSMQMLSLLFSGAIALVATVFLNTVSHLLKLDVPFTILLLLYLVSGPIISFTQNRCRYEYKYKQNIAIAWFISFGTVITSLLLLLIIPGDKALLRVLGIVVPNLILSIFLWTKSILNKEVSINTEYWKYGLQLSVPLVLHTISMNILGQSDRLFIKNYFGGSQTGIYSLVYSYGMVLSVITVAITDGWLPWFHDNYFVGNYKEIRTNSQKVVVLGCFLGLGTIALAPEAILIWGGKDYMEGLPCVPPIVLGIVCQYVYTHYVSVELHLKQTKYVSFGTMLAAILNIVLNAIFVPKYGYVTAAYTTLVSYFCLMFLHFIVNRVVLKVKIYNDIFMFLSIIVTGVVSYILGKMYDTYVIRYLTTFVGLLVCVYIFRSYIITFFRKFLLRKKN